MLPNLLRIRKIVFAVCILALTSSSAHSADLSSLEGKNVHLFKGFSSFHDGIVDGLLLLYLEESVD